jgi:glycosyltransferase involved in cell wall biosynthesis
MQVTDLWADGRYPRVLHVIPSLAVGGTERQLVELIRRSGDPVRHHVAVLDEPGALAGEVPNPPVWVGPISRSPSGVVPNARAVRSLRALVRTRRFDLVHAHLTIAEVFAAAATPRPVPLVASRRGRSPGFEARSAFERMAGLARRHVDLLLCNSEDLARRTRSEARRLPQIRVIPNGVDLEAFSPVPMPPEEPPSVTVVANLHPYKGHDLFLRAFRLVADVLPSARATFVGDGPERSRLRALAGEIGLSDAVAFAGQVLDPRPHVAAAHVVALTSQHEGFPNALLEAMAMARPVIATRVGGIPELVRDGEEGFLTGPEAPEIADRVLVLLREADLRARMAAAARARAEDYSWDRVVTRTERAYRDLLGRAASRSR